MLCLTGDILLVADLWPIVFKIERTETNLLRIEFNSELQYLMRNEGMVAGSLRTLFRSERVVSSLLCTLFHPRRTLKIGSTLSNRGTALCVEQCNQYTESTVCLLYYTVSVPDSIVFIM